MPVIGLTFDGPYGVYHSMYDDFYWMNRFGDPGYRYHTLMAQLWGVLALRLANADVLPFDFGAYGRDIGAFVRELCGQDGPGLPRRRAGLGTCRRRRRPDQQVHGVDRLAGRPQPGEQPSIVDGERLVRTPDDERLAQAPIRSTSPGGAPAACAPAINSQTTCTLTARTSSSGRASRHTDAGPNRSRRCSRSKSTRKEVSR